MKYALMELEEKIQSNMFTYDDLIQIIKFVVSRFGNVHYDYEVDSRVCRLVSALNCAIKEWDDDEQARRQHFQSKTKAG